VSAPYRRGVWLTIAEYAQAYGITRSTIYKWLAADLLDTYRVGRCRRVRDHVPRARIHKAPSTRTPPKT
jgi:excisionase family DNA binding protein